MADDNRPTAPSPWKIRAERVLAVVLAPVLLAALYLAGKHLYYSPESGWVGLALLGLLLLAYLARGMRLTDVAVGKDGFSASLESVKQLVNQAIDTANSANDTAETAKRVAVESTAGGGSSGPAASALPQPVPAGVATERVIGPTPANDQQKNQWGGSASRNGRTLSARISDLENDRYAEVELSVTADTGAAPLDGKHVRFHLHQTFPKPVVTVVGKNGAARIRRWSFGAYTVGAEVVEEAQTFLELDLVDLAGAPSWFTAN